MTRSAGRANRDFSPSQSCVVRLRRFGLWDRELIACFIYVEGIQLEYYIAKSVRGEFSVVAERVIEALKAEGFGVLTDIDVKATMKKKLDLDFREYQILGACNPPLAHQALTADDKIGTMLPCNVVVQDLGGCQIEVAAINPAVSMRHIGNPTLKAIAEAVTDKLRRVIAAV